MRLQGPETAYKHCSCGPRIMLLFNHDVDRLRICLQIFFGWSHGDMMRELIDGNANIQAVRSDTEQKPGTG